MIYNTPSPPSHIRGSFLHPSLVASDHLIEFVVWIRLCLLPCPIFQKGKLFHVSSRAWRAVWIAFFSSGHYELITVNTLDVHFIRWWFHSYTQHCFLPWLRASSSPRLSFCIWSQRIFAGLLVFLMWQSVPGSAHMFPGSFICLFFKTKKVWLKPKSRRKSWAFLLCQLEDTLLS